jgi:hypothetical protein
MVDAPKRASTAKTVFISFLPFEFDTFCSKRDKAAQAHPMFLSKIRLRKRHFGKIPASECVVPFRSAVVAIAQRKKELSRAYCEFGTTLIGQYSCVVSLPLFHSTLPVFAAAQCADREQKGATQNIIQFDFRKSWSKKRVRCLQKPPHSAPSAACHSFGVGNINSLRAR